MASVFRRRISKQITSILRPFLEGEETKYIYDSLPYSLKFSQPKLLSPQFEISWKDVVKLKPHLMGRIHLNTVMTYLKNQEFPTSDGITSICYDSLKQDKLIFYIEQELFTSSVLLDICHRINTMPDHSTFFKCIPPETIVIDFSSPNIAKPFHYGHFRSTVIGNFIANICKYIGHDVTRINYLGDWGMQFGILAVGFNKFGSHDKLQADPLNHLFEVYKRANEENNSNPDFNEEARKYFERMEQGDPEVLDLWKKLRDISLEELSFTYKRLNITFEETHGESMYAQKAKEIIDFLLTKKVASKQEDNSIEVVVNKLDNSEDKFILQKSDGTSLYLTRDIAAAVDRKNSYHFDKMYYVVDSSQSKHFNHLMYLLGSMDYSWASDVHHVPFGRISNFSTRKGRVAFLSDILNEAKERMLENMRNSPNTKVSENMECVADLLGIASLIINDFRVRRKKDFKFEWEKVLSMKADSGVTLQYCHARLNSIKENCGIDLSLNCELTSLVEPEAISLIAHLSRFDEIIYQSYSDLEPCVLVHYMFSLRNEISRAIKVLPVKGSNPYVARARLLLFHASYLVLHKSFELMGITPLDKM
ncbi:probable arginine--tRNA ligase, mitochondrial [Parasteatoda tepidariorum]|uniref:probable arginine--tRNA ligase, mitochondrial n=1 Tax=Parasteatoda tepidariorum TaxID=114398 RepID=UPI001C7248A8|nr:probable arginine--tRNA ligase, mitochondrial isoform X2 [Parasteatoda tepidariorum]